MNVHKNSSEKIVQDKFEINPAKNINKQGKGNKAQFLTKPFDRKKDGYDQYISKSSRDPSISFTKANSNLKFEKLKQYREKNQENYLIMKKKLSDDLVDGYQIASLRNLSPPIDRKIFIDLKASTLTAQSPSGKP